MPDSLKKAHANISRCLRQNDFAKRFPIGIVEQALLLHLVAFENPPTACCSVHLHHEHPCRDTCRHLCEALSLGL